MQRPLTAESLALKRPQGDKTAEEIAFRRDATAAGFLLIEEYGMLPPLQKKEPQPHDSLDLLQLNRPYERKRSQLRHFQQRHSLGPLRMHTFYVAPCSGRYLWQGLALEQSWYEARQGGFLTRVVSGCELGSHEAQQWDTTIVPESVEKLRRGTFHTPLWKHPNERINRPMAIQYWLNRSVDLTELVFVLLEQDMALRRPFPSIVERVTKGKPVGQFNPYLIGTNFEDISCPTCPTNKEALYGGSNKYRFYLCSPWALHRDDLLAVSITWADTFAHLVQAHHIVNDHMAYAIAAAHNSLPHLFSEFLMIFSIRQEEVWNGTIIAEPSERSKFVETSVVHMNYKHDVGNKTLTENMVVDEAEGNAVQSALIALEATRKGPVAELFYWKQDPVPTGAGGARHDVLSCNCPLFQEMHTGALLPDVGEYWNLGWRRTMVFLELYVPLVNRALTAWKHAIGCVVPNEVVSLEFERLMENCTNAQRQSSPEGVTTCGDDPTSTEAPITLRRVLNTAQQLRLSHYSYWISDYVVTSVALDRKHFTFENASVARQRQWDIARFSLRK